jgi:nitroreductase
MKIKNETINCIKTRRSRRLFLSKEVPKDIVKILIECAITAPSSIDSQPWHFIIVKDENSKTSLAKLKEEDNEQHILTAPITIVVCVDTNKSAGRWIEDGVTATENLLLAAHDIGLGGVYVTGFNNEKPEVANKIRDVLSLPENIMPITILPIGYPDPSEKLEKKILLDSDQVTHQDIW